MANILIGIPYHKEKRYALNHLMDWLETADLQDAEVLMRWDMGEFGSMDAIKRQREFFRAHALSKGFTHLYFMDADTIPPLDVLPRLLAHSKDIVGALYASRKHGERPTPLAWRDTGDPYAALQEQGLVAVDGMGMGAVLFSAKALKEFTFADSSFAYDDWPVYRLLASKGIKSYVDTTLVCKHYATEEKYY